MLPWIILSIAAVRGSLARIVGLRWARVGGVDLAVPAAMAAVIWATIPQLGRDLAGIPFGVMWIVATAMVATPLRLLTRSWPAGARIRGSDSTGWARPPALGLILVAGVVVSWVLYDIVFWGQTIHLYDLNVYLGSASRWLDGGQPYMTAPVTSWPSSAGADFFLYPPPLLPVFGALSRLPNAPVSVCWVAFLIACGYKSYRLLGLPRILSVALLAFPPMTIGVESGNIASLAFLLFVAAIRTGGALVVDGLFKVQTGLPALWLIRQRHWRGLLAGAALVGAISLITLPLVGLDSWRSWWDGLGFRAASQAAVPELYGYSYARMLPGVLFGVVSVVVVAFALLFRGRSGLAALGVATIFASPALWSHGFVFALPALLMLESGAAVWLLLGAGAIGPNMWLLFCGAWVAVIAARRHPAGSLHPLAGTDGPWPRPTMQRPRIGSPARDIEPIGPGTPRADRSEWRASQDG